MYKVPTPHDECDHNADQTPIKCARIKKEKIKKKKIILL